MIRIKELRMEKNMSMAQISKELNIPYTTYVNYEKGKREPNSEMLVKIANYFNVTVDYLIGRTDENKAKATIENYDGKYLINLLTNKLGRKPTVKEMKLLSAIFDGICEYINTDTEQ